MRASFAAPTPRAPPRLRGDPPSRSRGRAFRVTASRSSPGAGATRRETAASGAVLLAGAILGEPLPAFASAADDEPRVTHRVFLDVGVCPTIVRADRALGAGGALCADAEPLGRVEIGLFGDLVPNVVAHFLTLATAPPGEGYAGTVFHRVRPGQYVLAGQAGSSRLGQVPNPRFPPNPELLAAASFATTHLRPGTVSLAVGAAAGEDVGGGGARTQTEFLITTGPAPVPSLDGANVVFGRVLRGLETVNAVARTPTFKPSGNSVAWNQVAEWVGDERAGKARESWSKPTKAIVITNAGVLE